MAVPLEQFVQQLDDCGILASEALKDLTPPLSTLRDAEELALELIHQKKLTKFQAEQIYMGRARALVLGNYLLTEKIGKGGMGQVFKALHRRMDRVVAVKLLADATNDDATTVARFEREVKTLAKFSHPNIVAAYDADCANGLHFLVMEFVEGKDLFTLVKRNGPLSLEQSLTCILQAARGLDAAHAAGIVHRDIKPGNLLLDRKGNVKVLDLGIARLGAENEGTCRGDLTALGTFMGTVDYMAPEQALDAKTADERADIYALGCSLYYLLTGKPIYQGDTVMKKLVAHREQSIPSLQRIRGDIPAQVESVFEKMVAKKVEQRFQTMEELIFALEPFRSFQKLNVIGPGSSLEMDDPDPADIIPLFQENSSTTNSSSTNSSSASESTIRPRLSPRRRQHALPLVGAGILTVIALLSAIAMMFTTKDGTLVITVDQSAAEVQVLDELGNGSVTRTKDSEPLAISLGPGKYRLKVSKDGFELFSQDFSIESGHKQQLEAMLIPLASEQNTVVTPAPETDSVTPLAPSFEQWIKDVAALTPDQQLEAVRLKLMELNPEFDGSLTDATGDKAPTIVDGMITGLRLPADKVKDLSPVRALSGLRDLAFSSKSGRGNLSDLSPLKGMCLKQLNLQNTSVSDLSPLRGMKLKFLSCLSTRVSDLSPLLGMKLTRFNCGGTNVSDLAPLRGMPLAELYCHNTHVSDLSPLRGIPLLELFCHNTHVSDLSPLEGMPLTLLTISRTDVDNLSPLRGTPLVTLVCHSTDISDVSPLLGTNLSIVNLTPKDITQGLDGLRQMKTIKTIGVDGATSMPAAEFWKKYDAGDFGKPAPSTSIFDINATAFQQWMSDVATLSAEMQLQAVSQKLVEFNPGFDGKMTDSSGNGKPRIDDGVVTRVGFLIERVADISPVRALSGLMELKCTSSQGGESLLSDLSPIKGMSLFHLVIQSRNLQDLTALEGMPLQSLNCQYCPVKDLSPLRKMPLRRLILSETKVADLAPLDGMKLNELHLNGTRVKEISILRGMCLRLLKIDATRVSDLSPVQGMPLTSLFCRFTPVSDLSPLSELPLSTLHCDGSSVADLSPLLGMELTEIYFSPERITKGIDAIRQMTSIENIGVDSGSRLSPDQFWRKYDSGELGKRPTP